MKKLRLLLLTVALPALAVMLWSFVALRNSKPNGFVREFVTAPKLIAEAKSVFTLTGIACASTNTIYFKGTSPNLIYAYNSALTSFATYNLNTQAEQRARINFDVEVDSPTVRVYAGNLLQVCTGSLNSTDSFTCNTIAEKFFTNALYIGNNSYLIRSYKHAVKDFILGKSNLQGINTNVEQQPILKHDMGFSTQVNLLYDKEHAHLLMVYKLLNKIICLDTNLKPVYTAHTIDTIQSTGLKYEVLKQHKGKKGTIASAPKYTNYRACIDGKKLYIYSMLKADNEIDPDAPVIDVYNVLNGSYTNSFELPQHNNRKLSDFKVRNGKLVALYKGNNQVKIYQLNPTH